VSEPRHSGRTLSSARRLAVERMLADGDQVFGPGPVPPSNTTPTPDDAITLPGMHLQIARGSRLINGFGATADEAFDDALKKLQGYKVNARTR
jgi:hypothetical protein